MPSLPETNVFLKKIRRGQLGSEPLFSNSRMRSFSDTPSWGHSWGWSAVSGFVLTKVIRTFASLCVVYFHCLALWYKYAWETWHSVPAVPPSAPSISKATLSRLTSLCLSFPICKWGWYQLHIDLRRIKGENLNITEARRCQLKCFLHLIAIWLLGSPLHFSGVSVPSYLQWKITVPTSELGRLSKMIKKTHFNALQDYQII